MVQCPYCQHVMELRGLNPGTFSIRCAGCAKQFPVTVASPGAEPVVCMPSRPAALIPAPSEPAPAMPAASAASSVADPHRFAADLERLVHAFHEAPSAGVRLWAVRGMQVGTVAVVLGFAAAQLWWWAGGFVVCMALSWLFYEILTGITGRNYLYQRARALLFALGIKEWARILVGVALVALALFVLDLIPTAILLMLLALGIAAVMAFGIDHALAAERAATLADAQAMLTRLRLAGAQDEAIRKFICEFGGDGWEEFYEALFGYESKLEAREAWSKAIGGHERPEYAAWRDPIAAWISRRLELAKQRREQPSITPAPAQAVDLKLVTDGKESLQARRMAELMSEHGEQTTQQDLQRLEQATPAHPAHPASPVPPPPVSEVAESDAGDDAPRRGRGSYLARRYGGPLDILFAPRLRFFLAAILLTGFLVWRYENRGALLAEVEKIQQQDLDQTVVLKPPTGGDAKELASSVAKGDRPLRIGAVPDVVCDTVGSWPGGTAGLILLISSFMEGWVCGLLMYLAAGLALFGANVPLLQSISGGHPQLAAILLGGVLALLTMVFKRRGS